MVSSIMKKLEGKIAVVTGASYGIGRAVAIGLAREGCDVVLIARGQDGLEETERRVKQEGRTALVIKMDISNVEQVKVMAKKVSETFEKIDLLFNGASATSSPEDKLTILEFDKIAEICDTTVRGTFLVTKALLPLLKRDDKSKEKSKIIFMASDWALSGSHGPSVFSGAKAAVRMFSYTLKYEVLGLGIKPTVIVSGDIASFDRDWEDPKWDLDDDASAVQTELGTSRILLARIVDLVIHISSGEMIVVDEVHISPEDPTYTY